MSLPFKQQILDQDLEDWGVHKRAMEDTAPTTAGANIYTDPDGRAAGIWECGPGKYRLERASDELCVVLQGHWKLIGDEGDNYELRAGDVIYLKKGWKGISHVIETIRKVYMTNNL